MDLPIGQRVLVKEKDIQGVVAFVGTTSFAAGKWIGLILDEPKGKNNGSIRGTEYFKCEENYGMFVRPPQVIALDANGKPIEVKEESQSGIARPKARPSTSRMSLAGSRQSLAGSRQSLSTSGSGRQSLSSSRQSLSGSRQSLSGSRSHLALAVTEKSSESELPPAKTASFVETGFAQTLKPQFTPGQAMTSTPTPISTIEEKLGFIQLQQECENRNQQIKDLSEKLDTLKMKRQEDKERVRDYDKLKIQLDQLLEFKSKIMESQQSLQRELQRAKQEAKDAIEAKENHADEVADLAEAVEMATLDKEMAEEKAETLQLELSVCKEKMEEVTLDLEILKNEMQSRTSGVPKTDEMSTYEIKQLQQQNARLRETLVAMRDMSAHDKHEYQKLMKDVDQKKSEIQELGKTKEKLSARVETMEQQIADLQEQVDAALGAEEMVVLLGEQKLTLEEKVVQLEEEILELEALQDMNNQLIEGNAELEAELREELDSAKAATRQAVRDREAAVETIADHESTINKFRDLVQKLRDQSVGLQQQLEKESSKPMSALPEILDFKKMFTETKAHTKAIDLELRRVDILQLQQHIKYLSCFMPESFMSRGSDHDAVLVLLLIQRLIEKSEILLGQIKDKFAVVQNISKTEVLKNHSVDQYAYRCRVFYYIYALLTILHQYYFNMNCCNPEVLLKVGGTYPEIAAQEKVIDGFIELVKRDQLDENVPIDAFEKCVQFFNTLFPVILGGENKLNHTQLLLDNVMCLTSACEGIKTDAQAILVLIDGSSGDIGALSNYIVTTSDELQQQIKLIKRRLPTDPNISNLGLNVEVKENMHQCYQQGLKVLKCLQDIVKTAVSTLSSSGEAEKGIAKDKIAEIAIRSSDKIYEQDDLGPVQSIKNSLMFILTQVTQLAQFLQDNEYEITTANKAQEKLTPPILVRANLIKKELEQTKTLSSRLENKESDIKELRKALKEKQEHLSEMTIRKELAEKKLGNVNKDYELTIEKLQRKYEETQNTLKKKEKEFEDTLDHLQNDIDSLETEKGEMKEKFKNISKKAHMESSLSKNISGSQPNSMTTSGPNLPVTIKDSPLLLQEIGNLRKLFYNERNERIKLENTRLKKTLDSMAPLPSFENKHDPILDSLYKEGAVLKQDVLLTLAKNQFPAIHKLRSDRHAAWQKHFAKERSTFLTLNQKVQQFQDKVITQIVDRKFGGKRSSDFAIFPTIEMTKVIQESKTLDLGYVKIPKVKGIQETSGTNNFEINLQGFQEILQSIRT